MNFIRLNVFCSPEELAELNKIFNSKHSTTALQEKCHSFAIAHGLLPVGAKRYGIDLETGEFLIVQPPKIDRSYYEFLNKVQ